MRDVEQFSSARAFPVAAGVQQGGAGAIICENFDILRKVVGETDCTWLVAPAFIAAELQQGRMVMLDVEDLPTPATDISLVYLRDRTRSPAALLATEHLRAMMVELAAE